VLTRLCRENAAIAPRETLRCIQKLLDRVLFCAFCEDRGLLPAESLKHAFEHLDPGNTVICRSRLDAKANRNFEVFTATDFLAAITQHIPDKGAQMVRYYVCADRLSAAGSRPLAKPKDFARRRDLGGTGREQPAPFLRRFRAGLPVPARPPPKRPKNRQILPVGRRVPLWHHSFLLSGARNQFFLTREASSTSGRAKNQILISSKRNQRSHMPVGTPPGPQYHPPEVETAPIGLG
jgi:Putative transposase